MKRPTFLLALSASTLIILGACQNIYGPTATPKGYANLHKYYKSEIPARPFFIGPEYSADEVAQSEALWISAVTDLINQLEDEAVMDTLVISLQPAKPTDSFQVRMDHYVRQVFQERGYMIVTDTPEGVPVIEYSGYLVRAKTPLSIIDGGNPLGETEGYPEDMPESIRENDEITNIWLSLEIVDLSAKRRADRILLEVRNLYPILNKDLREIAADIPYVPQIAGRRKPKQPPLSMPKLPNVKKMFGTDPAN